MILFPLVSLICFHILVALIVIHLHNVPLLVNYLQRLFSFQLILYSQIQSAFSHGVYLDAPSILYTILERNQFLVSNYKWHTCAILYFLSNFPIISLFHSLLIFLYCLTIQCIFMMKFNIALSLFWFHSIVFLLDSFLFMTCYRASRLRIFVVFFLNDHAPSSLFQSISWSTAVLSFCLNGQSLLLCAQFCAHRTSPHLTDQQLRGVWPYLKQFGQSICCFTTSHRPE